LTFFSLVFFNRANKLEVRDISVFIFDYPWQIFPAVFKRRFFCKIKNSLNLHQGLLLEIIACAFVLALLRLSVAPSTLISKSGDFTLCKTF
jgi:hypothetical protein